MLVPKNYTSKKYKKINKFVESSFIDGSGEKEPMSPSSSNQSGSLSLNSKVLHLDQHPLVTSGNFFFYNSLSSVVVGSKVTC